MTAAAEHRRRATRIAAVGTMFVLAVVLGAGFVGARALYQSTDGRDVAGPERETIPMPDAPNALVGVTSTDGTLSALAVFTQRPRDPDAGSVEPGGSIVPLPITAAVTSGDGLIPLVARFDGGAESLEATVGTLLGVTFDQTVVVDESGLADLLEPVTSATVTLPADVVAHDEAESSVLFDAGEQEITGADAAEILAAPTSPDGDAAATENAAAVWSAVAAERTEAAESAPADVIPAREGDDLGELVGTLVAGPVEVRELHATPVEAETERAMVAIDRIDALLVFGQVSPRNVVGSSPSYSVRVVAPFSADDLAEGTSADVAYEAIELLVGEDINVISVSTTPGDVPAKTRIDVVNSDAADFAARVGDDLFGEHELGEIDENLAGIDLVVTLGEEFVT